MTTLYELYELMCYRNINEWHNFWSVCRDDLEDDGHDGHGG